jgi:hypothetical protein
LAVFTVFPDVEAHPSEGSRKVSSDPTRTVGKLSLQKPADHNRKREAYAT